jgi:hypothetical protein
MEEERGWGWQGREEGKDKRGKSFTITNNTLGRQLLIMNPSKHISSVPFES